MKQLFPKIIHINTENQLEMGPDVHRVLRYHASSVMRSLGAAVESLDQSDLFESIVEDIGRLHADRNVNVRMIQVRI